MRKLRTLVYIIKQSITGLVKNWYMLLASVFVLFVGLLVMGMLSLTSINIRHILSVQAEQPQVEIICKTTVSDDDSLVIERTILLDSRIKSCTRISREENLERLKEIAPGYEDLFQYENKDSEFLYVSFDVVLDSAQYLEGFTEDIKKVSGVDQVESNQSVYDYFTKINTWVKTGTVAALVVLLFLSVLLMYNTIKLTVVARQKELIIMKYVGASTAFMRGPFVLEGLVIGAIGAVLAFFAVKGVYAYIDEAVINADESVREIITLIPFSDISGKVLLAFLIGGMATGLVSSMITIKNYIKV